MQPEETLASGLRKQRGQRENEGTEAKPSIGKPNSGHTPKEKVYPLPHSSSSQQEVFSDFDIKLFPDLKMYAVQSRDFS